MEISSPSFIPCPSCHTCTSAPNGVNSSNMCTPCRNSSKPVENIVLHSTTTIKLNPAIVPAKFIRYRHPSHKHRLFMVISFGHNYCNNLNCRINIAQGKTIFRCFRCDYDLCEKCFQLDFNEDMVPLADDDKTVNETTIRPINELLFVSTNVKKDLNDDSCSEVCIEK